MQVDSCSEIILEKRMLLSNWLSLIMIKKVSFLVRLISLLFFLLIFDHVYAQSKKDKVFQSLKVEVGLGSIYNDNILKYSDYYLTKFKNNEDSGRFHINTSDGLVLDQSIKISSTFLLFGHNKTIIDGSFSRQSYINNKIKTWNQIDFDLQQNITRRLIINLSYSYLPKFYIRHYRDDDWVDLYGYVPETFQPFEFSKNEYGFWIQHAFFNDKQTKLRLSFDYGQYYYNKHFTEYNSTNLNYGINIYQTVKKKIKLEVGYQFVNSDAKGYDATGETKDNSNDSDPSYKADEYSGGIKWSLPMVFQKSHDIDIDFGYKRSCYTTKHYLENDRLHAGRIDDLYKIGVNYEIRLSAPLTVTCFYKWYKQDSDTKAKENQELVSQEKDFTQQQYGLTLTYTFKDIKLSHSNSKK
jgi:hypothetical protein